VVSISGFNVNVGHIIELKQGARFFLKASHVISFPDFDELLKPESTFLRYKLAEERLELRERYRSKAKASRKRKVVECTSSSKDSGNNNEKPPPSQRQVRKQTLLPSFLQPSPSPLDAIGEPKPYIFVLSSDDRSSGPSWPLKKRRASRLQR
jgi:hypothetical protein